MKRMFHYIFYSVSKFKNNFYSYYTSNIDTYKLLLIFWISRQILRFQKFIDHIEKKNLDMNIIRIIKYIYSFLTKTEFEPKEDYWANYLIELKGDNKSNCIVEYYDKTPFIELNSDEIQKKCEDLYKESINMVNSHSKLLLTIKNNDIYITKQINNTDLMLNEINNNNNFLEQYQNDYNFNMIKTKRFFISVEYYHPMMKNTISININPYYIVGNDILSCLFVYRYLKYQSEYYIFNNDYKIILMDNNFNTYSIGSLEYLTLCNDHFIIKNYKSLHTTTKINRFQNTKLHY